MFTDEIKGAKCHPVRGLSVLFITPRQKSHLLLVFHATDDSGLHGLEFRFTGKSIARDIKAIHFVGLKFYIEPTKYFVGVWCGEIGIIALRRGHSINPIPDSTSDIHAALHLGHQTAGYCPQWLSGQQNMHPTNIYSPKKCFTDD